MDMTHYYVLLLLLDYNSSNNPVIKLRVLRELRVTNTSFVEVRGRKGVFLTPLLLYILQSFV